MVVGISEHPGWQQSSLQLLYSDKEHTHTKQTCLDEAKEERDLERGARRDTGRYSEITSRVSPNPPYAVWPGEVV